MASNRAGGSKGKTSGKAGAKAGSSTGKAGAKARSTKAAKAPVQEARNGSDAVLERGDVFFFYRPNVDETSPGGLLDVRRFHVALRPEGGEVLRMITGKPIAQLDAEFRKYLASQSPTTASSMVRFGSQPSSRLIFAEET